MLCSQMGRLAFKANLNTRSIIRLKTHFPKERLLTEEEAFKPFWKFDDRYSRVFDAAQDKTFAGEPAIFYNSLEAQLCRERGIKFGRPNRHINYTVRPQAPRFVRPKKGKRVEYPCLIVDPGKYYYKKVNPEDTHKDLMTNKLNFVHLRSTSKRMQEIDIPHFCAGSILRIKHQVNAASDRTTSFVGIVIGVFRRGHASSVLLRNVLNGVSIEKKFPLFSPTVKSIEVIRYQMRNRNKLFYLRDHPLKESQIPQNVKGPREMSETEIAKNNELCKILEHRRRENRNLHVLRNLKNKLRKKYVIKEENQWFINNPAVILPRLERAPRLRIRKVMLRLRRKFVRAYNLYRKRCGSRRVQRKKIKEARILSREANVKKLFDRRFDPVYTI